jgi:uncharacterized protein
MNSKMHPVLAFALALLVMHLSASVNAASFDCTKAHSSMETLICSDAELSALDEALAKNYTSARDKLSPSAAKVFTTGQLSWLRFHSTYCFVNYDASNADAVQAKKCLAEAYSERIKEFKSTGEMTHGWRTYSVVDSAIKISLAEQSIYTVQRNYVQLDSATSSAQNLNRYLAFTDRIKLDEERGSESYVVRLAELSPDWLQKTKQSEVMIGAYPTSGTECGVYALSLHRPLRIADIFTTPSWALTAKKFAETHFTSIAATDKEFDLSMLNGYSQFDLPPTAEISFCMTADGFYVDGFLPHVVRALDGVTMPWNIFANHLTSYARKEILAIKKY